MKFYLAGPICHDEASNDWRIKLIESLPNHEFWNPLDKEANNDYRTILLNLRKDAEKDASAITRIREIMCSHIIPNDLEGVKWADGIICYVKKGIRAWGSICEIYEAQIKQKKPVYLISEIPYSEMNNWEIALSSGIFFSIDEFIRFFLF